MKNAHTPRIAIEFLLTGMMGRRRLQGVFEYLRQRQLKWDIRLPQNEEELARELGNRPDGVIVSRILSKRMLRRLENYPAPVVFVDIPPSDRRKMRQQDATIHNDDGGIGLMAADYLMKIGRFNAFGVYPSPTPRYFSIRRSQAFAAAVRRHGYEAHVFDAGREKLVDWLRRLPKPAAVFATWDESARDVLLACHQARIRVPEQLVLLGADDDEIICTLMSPELSSIRLDSEKEGFRAAEELNRILRGRGKSEPSFVLVKPLGISERASTKAPPPATVLVNRALDFIAANAVRGATPDAVAHHVGCSRRLLDLRFRQFHARSVQDELTAVRLNAVRKELRGTNDAIADIAARCGFSSPGVLRNLFRRQFGKSMREWRQRPHD